MPIKICSPMNLAGEDTVHQSHSLVPRPFHRRRLPNIYRKLKTVDLFCEIYYKFLQTTFERSDYKPEGVSMSHTLLRTCAFFKLKAKIELT